MDMRIQVKLPDLSGEKGMQFAILRAAASGINKAAISARAMVAQSIREEYTAQSSAIKSRIEIKKANMRRLQAEIIIDGKPILLGKFKLSGTGKKRIVKTQVKKELGMIPLRHSFVASIKGVKTIWQRKGKPRFPVKALRGPSVPGMVRATIFKKIEPEINERVNREVQQAIQYAIGKGRVHLGS
jgi:hypothetical protein